MTKKIVLTAMIALTGLSADAQTLQWANAIGGTGNEFGLDITADAAGNSYTVAGFDGTIDCDPGPGTFNVTSYGLNDIIVTKLDATGNFVWAAHVGSTGSDYGYTLTCDAAGNVIVSGNFSGTVDFDPGAGVHTLTAAAGDAYILKLDAAGNFMWVDQLVGASTGISGSTGWGTATDAAGNIYVTGQYTGTIDLDPGAGISSYSTAGLGFYSLFLLKIDPSGILVWADGGMDCIYSAYAVGLCVDATGNVLISGQFNGRIDCDPGPGVDTLSGIGGSDGFVCKFDNAGALIWAKSIGGFSNEVCQEVITDASGNVYTTGSFKNTADFDPSAATYNLTSAGDVDVYVLKLDAAGNFVWVSAMGGSSYDLPSGLGMDASGNIYTSGSFGGSGDYDPGAGVATITAASDNIFISELDNNGNYVSAVSLGGSSSDGTNGMFVNAAGTIYITGDFKSTADFAPGAATSTITSMGMSDIFIAKYTETATGIETNSTLQTALAYPNPFTASTVIEIANADAKAMELVLFNAAGQKVRQQQNLNGTSILIERGNLANGLYFYNVISNGEMIAKGKLIAE